MIKRITIACLLLFCVLGASALADITGVWSYTNGVRTHGDGFVLHADGTGEWLETLNNAYLPANQFLRTGNTFAWETVQEGEKQFLVETAPNGSVRRFALREGTPEIHLTDGADEGEYYPIKAEKAVLVNDRLDIITELQAVKGRFAKNKKYSVFQGPGAAYGRSGNGKGVVSTNGPIYCYGTRNNYLLIEYEISRDKHRYGWIALSSLPAGQADDYSPLDFSRPDDFGYICGVITHSCVLTDDPFYSGNAVADFPAGTSVFVLMRDGDYLLVEGFVGKQKHMGFVPSGVVDMKYGYAENTVHTIDEAVSYSAQDIHAAMEAVEEAVRQWFSGASVVEIKYIEAESADPTDWWQPGEENREGMQLFADLNDMSFYEYEIAAYGVAKDYGFILYRDKNGGEWEVCNWGYE